MADIICIGPQKTGTSWIHFVLSDSEEVFLPRFKEISYFFSKQEIEKDNLFNRIQSKHWFYRSMMRQYFYAEFRHHLKNLFTLKWDHAQFLWDYKLLFNRPNSKWYSQLFPEDKIGIDISPLYSLLKIDSIKKMKVTCSNSKIIICLRNPLDRSLSRAQMLIGRKNDFDFDSFLKKCFDFDRYETPSYSKLLSDYSKVYGRDAIHIVYYDEIKNEPNKVIKQLMDIVGIEELNLSDEKLSKRINISEKINFPHKIVKDLGEYYLEELDELKRRNPEIKYIDEWQKEIRLRIN